jgi:uncharacterized protein YdiU (UPF0061 family)
VLASALSSLVERTDAQAALDVYEGHYHERFLALMREKLGLTAAEDGDARLVAEFLAVLEASHADYTLSFRRLASIERAPSPADAEFAAHFSAREPWEAWLAHYRERLAREPRDDAARRAAMLRINPKYILRNYLAQLAIEAAERGDFGEIARLHAVLRAPFDEQPENQAYAQPAPAWAKTLSVSCSS